MRTAADRLCEYQRYARFDAQDAAEVRFLADFFNRRSRKLDRSYFVVTFRELKSILERYGFTLANARKNYIDVVEISSGKKFKQIGYPGASKEVNVKAMKSVRKATGLTADNWIDSRVFFKAEDPLPDLVIKYEGALERLKDA